MFPSLLIFLRAEVLAQFALIVPLGLFLHASMGVSVAYAQELLPNRPALAASLVQGGNWFLSGLTLAGMGALGDRLGLGAALQLLAVLVLAEIVAALALPKEEV